MLKSFNRWRRERCSFRLIVIILIFTPILSELVVCKHHSFLINELVWIACQAIRNGSEGNTQSALARYYRYCEKKRLQKELSLAVKAKVIPVDNPVLKELTKKPSAAHLKLLFLTAQKYELVDPSLSLRQLKRGFIVRAKGEYEVEFGEDWKTVDSMIFNQQIDYSKWSTWRNGIVWVLIICYEWLDILLPYGFSFLLLLLLTYFCCAAGNWKYLIWVLIFIPFYYCEQSLPEYFSSFIIIPLWAWRIKTACIELIAVLLGIKLNKLYPAAKFLRILKERLIELKVQLMG